MKNWKKNAVVASILVFVCAGIYLNWLYTQDTETADLVDTLDQEKILGSSTLVMSQNDDLAADAAKEDLSDVSGEVTDYFAAVRLSRQESRDSAVSMLQEAMSYGEDAQSTSASQELEGLVETALCEAQIESLVIAKGYTDCVAYMSDGGISVAVAAPEEARPFRHPSRQMFRPRLRQAWQESRRGGHRPCRATAESPFDPLNEKCPCFQREGTWA